MNGLIPCIPNLGPRPFYERVHGPCNAAPRGSLQSSLKIAARRPTIPLHSAIGMPAINADCSELRPTNDASLMLMRMRRCLAAPTWRPRAAAR